MANHGKYFDMLEQVLPKVDRVIDYFLNVLDEVDCPFNDPSLIESLGKDIGSPELAKQLLDEVHEKGMFILNGIRRNPEMQRHALDLITGEWHIRGWVSCRIYDFLQKKETGKDIFMR